MDTLWKQVQEIWLRKPDQSKHTLQEDEMVYRWYYSEMETATEEQLHYRIAKYSNMRYSRKQSVNAQWFVLLISQYPNTRNYDTLEAGYPDGQPRFRKILRRVIDLPDVSKEALELIVRKNASNRARTRKRLHRRATERLEKMRMEAWDPAI